MSPVPGQPNSGDQCSSPGTATTGKVDKMPNENPISANKCRMVFTKVSRVESFPFFFPLRGDRDNGRCGNRSLKSISARSLKRALILITQVRPFIGSGRHVAPVRGLRTREILSRVGTARRGVPPASSGRSDSALSARGRCGAASLPSDVPLRNWFVRAMNMTLLWSYNCALHALTWSWLIGGARPSRSLSSASRR